VTFSGRLQARLPVGENRHGHLPLRVEPAPSLADVDPDVGLVVRNGHAQAGTVSSGAGPIEIEAFRVNDCWVDDATGAVPIWQLDRAAVMLMPGRASPRAAGNRRRARRRCLRPQPGRVRVTDAAPE
jgi:hypothetical protein